MSSLENFADETGVFGLNLMRNYLSKTEKIFWIFATCVFTVLTVHDLRTVVNVYMADETLTSVSLNEDEPITFDPAPTMQIHKHESFLLPEANISNDSLRQILETTFAVTMNPKTIPEVLFYINLRLFNHISIGIEVPTLYPNLYTKPDKIDWDLLIAYNFYRKNNISLVHLQKVTGTMLCEWIGFSIKLPGEEDITNICQSDFIEEMHGFSVLLKLSLRPITFSDTIESLSIQVKIKNIQFVKLILFDLEGSQTQWNDVFSPISVELFENSDIRQETQFRIESVLRFEKEKRAGRDCRYVYGDLC